MAIFQNGRLKPKVGGSRFQAAFFWLRLHDFGWFMGSASTSPSSAPNFIDGDPDMEAVFSLRGVIVCLSSLGAYAVIEDECVEADLVGAKWALRSGL